jgi:hypothetical protein
MIKVTSDAVLSAEEISREVVREPEGEAEREARE